jgi:hypothetical protein
LPPQTAAEEDGNNTLRAEVRVHHNAQEAPSVFWNRLDVVNGVLSARLRQCSTERRRAHQLRMPALSLVLPPAFKAAPTRASFAPGGLRGVAAAALERDARIGARWFGVGAGGLRRARPTAVIEQESRKNALRAPNKSGWATGQARATNVGPRPVGVLTAEGGCATSPVQGFCSGF